MYSITSGGLMIFLGFDEDKIEERVRFFLDNVEVISKNNPSLLPVILAPFRNELNPEDRIFLSILLRKMFSIAYFSRWFHGAWLAPDSVNGFPVEVIREEKRSQKLFHIPSISKFDKVMITSIIESDYERYEVHRFLRLIGQSGCVDMDALGEIIKKRESEARERLKRWTDIAQAVRRN